MISTLVTIISHSTRAVSLSSPLKHCAQILDHNLPKSGDTQGYKNCYACMIIYIYNAREKVIVGPDKLAILGQLLYISCNSVGTDKEETKAANQGWPAL